MTRPFQRLGMNVLSVGIAVTGDEPAMSPAVAPSGAGPIGGAQLMRPVGPVTIPMVYMW